MVRPTPHAREAGPPAVVSGTVIGDSSAPPAPTDDGDGSSRPAIQVHRARVADVRQIKELVDVYAGQILLEKSLATLYENVTECWVATAADRVVGCGALHVLWEDLAEIRTVATDPALRGRGVGRVVCEEIITEARRIGVTRLFVLTFEVSFFAGLGFEPIGELDLSEQAYAELRSSYDAGVAEFLDLPFVKPNTLGNTRMLKHL